MGKSREAGHDACGFTQHIRECGHAANHQGDEEIFVGYLALFAPEVGHTNCTLYEQHKNDTVVKFRAVPEITHRKWKELNLMPPLRPDETPDYKFQELQMKLYYTIYL